jgi:hypothetical protein
MQSSTPSGFGCFVVRTMTMRRSLTKDQGPIADWHIYGKEA